MHLLLFPLLFLLLLLEASAEGKEEKTNRRRSGRCCSSVTSYGAAVTAQAVTKDQAAHQCRGRLSSATPLLLRSSAVGKSMLLRVYPVLLDSIHHYRLNILSLYVLVIKTFGR